MNNDDINKLFIKEINNNIIFNEYKKINIFTTKFGYYIAESMKYILKELKFDVNIVYEIDLNNNDLYIILFSQKVQSFPKNYIIYQLEQKDISKWVDKKYKLSILFSKCSFDYSQSNINKFENIIQNKLIYIPIPLIPMKLINPNIINDNMINTNNNILFYGSMNDIRKTKLFYLKKRLYPKYNVKIVNDIYGEKMIEEIMKSKIILNIHFYKDAILETARINEVLSCDKIVISEYPNIIDYINYDLYKNKVFFVKNIDEMYIKIIEILNIR
jgi:hypothetical protein